MNTPPPRSPQHIPHVSPYSSDKNLTALTLSELREDKKKNNEEVAKNEEEMKKEGWVRVKRREYEFFTPVTDSVDAFLTLDVPRGVRKVDLFMKLYPKTLVETIVNRLNQDDEMVRSNGSRFTVDVRTAYQFLAHYIWVCARQNKLKRVEKKKQPLRVELQEASKYFLQSTTPLPVLGMDLLQKLAAHFFITPEEEKLLNQAFQSQIINLGEWLAGDEKLFKFTGASGWVRKCLKKPDKLGLWNYELTGRLSNGKPFLIYTRIHNAVKLAGQRIPCSEIMKDWGNIIASSPSPDTMLVADSYYLDNAGRKVLQEIEVSYICGIQKSQF